MKKLSIIDEKPINKIVSTISNSKHNGIILAGLPGSGKSMVLENFIKENDNFIKPVIDVTPQPSILYISNNDLLNKLYYTCMVIKSMLIYIEENYQEIYNSCFILFSKKIDYIMFDIRVMLSTFNYSVNNTRIPLEYVNNPELLLEEFINKAIYYLDFKSITLIIDNFDKEHSSNKIYQTYLYKLLQDYLKVVVAVSDINNPTRMNALANHNDVIYVDYSKNIDTVCNILDHHIMNGNSYLKKPPFNLRIRFIFSDADILALIEKTNGNLFYMLRAIRIFYSVINYIDKNNYTEALFNILDKEILVDPSISGVIPTKRTLYLS